MEPTKPWWASRTIWANVLGGMVAVAAAFGFDIGITAEEQATIVGGMLAAVNIYLRVTTNTRIGR